MNDQDVMAVVREPFATVHMVTPLDAVVARGRAHRRRRRIPALAGAGLTVIAAVVAIALGTASGPDTASLAAWTVSTKPAVVTVTVRELRDSATLQRVLRADGVPALIYFGRVAPDAHCGSTGRGDLMNKIFTSGPWQGAGTRVHIHLTAIPSGVALAFSFFRVKVVYTTATGTALQRLSQAEQAKMPPGVTALVYSVKPGQPIPPHPAGISIASALQLLTTSGRCLG